VVLRDSAANFAVPAPIARKVKCQFVCMNKKDLSERDICSKFIGPAIKRAGWDGMMQIREEVAFKGRIIVRGKLVTRGKAKRADYILYYKPNLPIANVEARDTNHSVGDGMQQALDYATTLNIPFVFSSNGDGFVFHDRTGASAQKEVSLTLDQFPSALQTGPPRPPNRQTLYR
jgi:type I restriction enzyme, R subunit